MLWSVLDGILSSSPIVCLALVYGLLYGVLGIMDLTVPARFAAAGYAACIISGRLYPSTNPVWEPLSWAVAVLGSVALTLPLWLLLQPLTRAVPLVTLVGSLGLTGLLQAVYQAIFGAAPLVFQGYPAENGISLVGTTTTTLQLVSFGYSLLVVSGIGIVLYGTSFGKKLRIMSEDPEVAACVFGMNTNQLISRAVLLCSVILAPSGFLYSVGHGVTPTTGSEIGLTAFVATIVAGRRRPLAAAGVALAMILVGTAAIRWNLSEVLGALLVIMAGFCCWRGLATKSNGTAARVAVAIGGLFLTVPAAWMIESLLPTRIASAQLPSDFQPLVPYMAVVGALLWRPLGVFGRKSRLV